MTQRALPEVVVVEPGVAFERGLQILARAEVRGRQDVADAPIEALDHAVGLRMTRLGEPVLDAEQGARTIEGVLARGFLALGGEAIGELAAVVGQHLLDLHGRFGAQAPQEAGDKLFTFLRYPDCQWRSIRTSNAIERLNEEFRRRIKIQCVLPCAESVCMLFSALLASGQITLRKVDGWQTLNALPIELDRAA